MIAIDSSVLIPWINQVEGLAEVERFEELIRAGLACVAPVTITELLSSVSIGPAEAKLASTLIRLPLTSGYWDRAGRLRSELKRRGRKSKLGDTLIAQACIDADVPLLTRDADFAIFAEIGRAHV